MKRYEVLIKETRYLNARVNAETEEEAQARAILARPKDGSQSEVIAVRELRSDE